MKKISRRQFLNRSAMGLGSALVLPGLTATSGRPPFSTKLPLGFQVWTIKDDLVKDFPGTLSKMAALGYQTVEMCSPPGYESSGFGPLMKLSGSEMKKIVDGSGLKLVSTHYGWDELKKNLGERITFASESGQNQMVLSSFGLPENASADDWKRSAEALNAMGEKTRKAGIQMGFHNHHGEFSKIDNTLIYDLLMQNFDPELVKMQFQVAVISIGYKAVDYFKKYQGRFLSAHLADWSPQSDNSVPLGKGIVNWKEFFASTDMAGIKNVFVEMDPVTFPESAEYYRKNI